jgi:hypothetical protein
VAFTGPLEGAPSVQACKKAPPCIWIMGWVNPYSDAIIDETAEEEEGLFIAG